MTREATNLTVWDSIEADLYTAMTNVKETDGYNYTVKEVVFWGLDDFPFTKMPPLIGLVIGNEICEDNYMVAGRRCKRDVGIEMWVPAPMQKRGESTLSRAYQRLVADIEKTLYVDHTRGGYAEDTEILERAPLIDPDARLVGAAIRARVIYRHLVGDAYTVY